MQPLVFREAPLSRRRWTRLIAFVIAFGATLLISFVVLAIWDDNPQTTNELVWSEVPPVRFWAFFLILLGTPALTILLAFVLPLPVGQTVTVDADGIRRQSKFMPSFWPWSNVRDLALYPHPDGKSFIKITIAGADDEPRITDIYETPLVDMFEDILSARSHVSGVPAVREQVAPGEAVAFDADRQKTASPYSTMLFFLVIIIFALHGVIDFPPALSIAITVVSVPIIVVYLVGFYRSFTSSGPHRLELDESGLALVEGSRREHVAWAEIGKIRLRGRVGFWATPRSIAVDLRKGSGRGGLAARLLGRPDLVIPDAFLASVDEIADRLNSFRSRLGQPGV